MGMYSGRIFFNAFNFGWVGPGFVSGCDCLLVLHTISICMPPLTFSFFALFYREVEIEKKLLRFSS